MDSPSLPTLSAITTTIPSRMSRPLATSSHHDYRCKVGGGGGGHRGSRTTSTLPRWCNVLWLVILSCVCTHHMTTPFVVVVDASAAGAAALQALSSMDYRYFVAGGTCAAFSHGITTPIDVIKTRIQADPKEYNKGLLDATVRIVKKDGPGTLLQGLGPTVVGYGIEGAMKFGVYEVAKPIFGAIVPDNKAVAFVLASFLAGAVAALLLVPMESLRIRQVTDPSFANDGILTGIPKLIQQDGFGGMMGGVWAMLAKQVPYTFGKQVSFDIIAAFLYSILATWTDNGGGGLGGVGNNELWNKWAVSVGAAFCASVVACLCSQPGDMILTETYRGEKPGQFGTVIDTIYQRGGVGEFFRGTQARIVHVGVIITSQLVVYDIVKQMLGLPATGTH